MSLTFVLGTGTAGGLSSVRFDYASPITVSAYPGGSGHFAGGGGGCSSSAGGNGGGPTGTVSGGACGGQAAQTYNPGAGSGINCAGRNAAASTAGATPAGTMDLAHANSNFVLSMCGSGGASGPGGITNAAAAGKSSHSQLYIGGLAGATVSSRNGGSGGGASPNAKGGDGAAGNGNPALTGQAGTLGAGGGGGGTGSDNVIKPGDGGAGGDGYVFIIAY